MAEPTKAIFLLMPEWQGSASSRAMLITDGAAHLREDLPPAARFDVAVPQQAGDALGTPVARLSSVVAARDAARETLRSAEDPAITLGGDCASTLAGLDRAAERDPGVAVIWFDAHPDLQHPSTSPSGAASGMALRHALGLGIADLNGAHPIDPSRVLLVGAREFDAEEAQAIDELGIRSLAATSEGPAEAVRDWLAEIGATSVYVHIDLDVLDPAEFAAVHAPVPFGLAISDLAGAVRAAVATAPLAGAAICEFAPATAEIASDDSPTVLRLLAALVSGGSR
ncbi:N(omega)-hydroxy-L-arginine amidinohydrolase [Leucobacter aridicollis]|uniref:arginase family protein n=1 Tax=Leucobacter aridicollis TaxID=283878 RepID=UPI0037C50920